jgi:hypothetical protein
VYKIIFMRAAYAAVILLLPYSSWAGENGKFSIQTTPQAMIIVDDIPARKSPLGNLVLTPGAHKVEYRLDSGKTEEFNLTIRAGRHLICNYDFETATHPCKEVDLKPLKKAMTGSFEAKSNVPADVTLDGKPIGKTPIAKTKLPLGQHRLEFRSANREPVLREFEVNPNEHLEIEATFEEPK